MASFSELTTPYLLLDPVVMQRNIDFLQQRMEKLGVQLRPHVKTAKSLQVAQRIFNGDHGPITVSTLKEAEYFAEHGYTDITYAVGISPDKLARVARLNRADVTVRVLLDSLTQAEQVMAWAAREQVKIPSLI